MMFDHAQLLHAPVGRWVGEAAFSEKVEPALQRCLAGEVVTHQLVLLHPEWGQRQFSVTYHPCVLGAGAVYAAMILRDVTIEKLATDGYLLYSQWRDALNAIDRASLTDQLLGSVVATALDRMRNLVPYRQAMVAVIDDLAELAGGDPARRTAAGLCVIAALPEDAVAADAAPTCLPLEVQGDPVGELAVWPLDGSGFGPGQLDMLNELANRLERALHRILLREQLSRYTVGLEHTIAERTQEIERREERERLAREMHDAVTQSIYSLTLFAEAGRRLASVGQLDRVQEYLTLLGDTAQQAMKQMSLMLYELRPAILEQVGLVQALRQRLDAVERRAGIDARLEVSEPLRLSPAIEESLYRICQEALNNALKHASAHTVVVRLQRLENEVLLEVSDDGVGFVPHQVGEAEGLGLNYIRDRVARLNAGLQIETVPDKGTTVRVSLFEPELISDSVRPASAGALPVD
jgi:signal transduction histidine kinase